jgi:hypothetical protein
VVTERLRHEKKHGRFGRWPSILHDPDASVRLLAISGEGLMKVILAAVAALICLQSTAWAIDINTLNSALRKGDRCRADVSSFKAMGLTTAGGGKHIMCPMNGFIGSRCYCYFGQYRVPGQIVRNADFADIKD